MTDFLWKAPANEYTSTSGDLNPCADATFYQLTGTLDNTSNRHTHCIIELELNTTVNMSAGNAAPVFEVYLFPTYDGTNYPTEGDDNAQYLKAFLGFQQAASQEFAVTDMVPIGPHKYTIGVKNMCGVALGNDNADTLSIKTYCMADA